LLDTLDLLENDALVPWLLFWVVWGADVFFFFFFFFFAWLLFCFRQDWSVDYAAASDAPNSHIDDVDDDNAEGDWLTEPSPLETSLARQDLKMLHESIKINKVSSFIECLANARARWWW
jgi:hypothetical protein